jgi:hypothetical protein
MVVAAAPPTPRNALELKPWRMSAAMTFAAGRGRTGQATALRARALETLAPRRAMPPHRVPP